MRMFYIQMISKSICIVLFQSIKRIRHDIVYVNCSNGLYHQANSPNKREAVFVVNRIKRIGIK